MVEGSVPPSLALDGAEQDAATTYMVDGWAKFEELMAFSWRREEMLAIKTDDLGWKVGRSIASLMNEGRDFQSAVLQVGSSLAANYQGGAVFRDVVELVKRVMSFPSSVGADAGQSSRSGSRSAAGGELRSKLMKIESLAIAGGSSSLPARPLPSSRVSISSDVDSLGDGVWCPASICVNVPLKKSDASVEVEVGEIVGDPLGMGGDVLIDSPGSCTGGSCVGGVLVNLAPSGCPVPVCENATVVSPAIPATTSAGLVGPEGNESLNQMVARSGLRSLGLAGGTDPICDPVASAVDGLVVGASGSEVPSYGLCSDAVTTPPVLTISTASGPCGNAVVAAVAEVVVGGPGENVVRSMANNFLPPAPGVHLSEWVTVAESRRGKKHVPNPVVRGGTFHARDGSRLRAGALPLNDAAAFPPLSRVDQSGAVVTCSMHLARSPEQVLGSTAQESNGLNNFSWKDLLRTSKPVDLGVDLRFVEPSIVDGVPCAVFTAEEESENMAVWQHTLLCYVVGNSPSYFQFFKAVNRLWKSPGGVEVFSRENGIFYCRFSSAEDMSRVIKDGPWYMDGKLIVVKKFLGETNCEEDMLSSIPIWVKLPGLPVKWWSTSGVSKVVSPIGHPLYFDVPSASQRRIAYARCCVEVDMEKSLPEFVTCIGGDKVKRKQKIEYEWVPKKCRNCMAFGHLESECKKNLEDVGPHAKKGIDQRKIKGGKQQTLNSDGQPTMVEEKGVNGNKDQRASEVEDNVVHGEVNCSIIAPCTNAFQPLANFEDEGPDDDQLKATNEKGSNKGETSVDIDMMGVTQQVVEEEGDTNKENGRNESDGVTCASEEDHSENPDGANPQFLEILGSGKSKKAKRTRKRPAAVRPEGARTTRHSGNLPME